MKENEHLHVTSWARFSARYTECVTKALKEQVQWEKEKSGVIQHSLTLAGIRHRNQVGNSWRDSKILAVGERHGDKLRGQPARDLAGDCASVPTGLLDGSEVKTGAHCPKDWSHFCVETTTTFSKGTKVFQILLSGKFKFPISFLCWHLWLPSLSPAPSCLSKNMERLAARICLFCSLVSVVYYVLVSGSPTSNQHYSKIIMTIPFLNTNFLRNFLIPIS